MNKLNKECSKCKLVKLKTDFARYSYGSLHCWCLSCEREAEELKIKQLKKCSKCHEIKSIDDYYDIIKNNINYKMSICKECHKELSTIYGKLNPECRAKSKKKYREKNREFENKKSRERRKIHKFDTLAKRINDIAIKNKDNHRVTKYQLWSLAKKQKMRCAISGVKLTNENISVDHIIPFAKGGTNSIDNLQLTTWEINRIKYSHTMDEFISFINKIYLYQKTNHPTSE